jgi:hypothetical protein
MTPRSSATSWGLRRPRFSRRRTGLPGGGNEAVEERIELAGAPEVLRVPLHAEAEARVRSLDSYSAHADHTELMCNVVLQISGYWDGLGRCEILNRFRVKAQRCRPRRTPSTPSEYIGGPLEPSQWPTSALRVDRPS